MIAMDEKIFQENKEINIEENRERNIEINREIKIEEYRDENKDINREEQCFNNKIHLIKLKSQAERLHIYLGLLKRIKENYQKPKKLVGIKLFLLLTIILLIFAGLDFYINKPDQEVYQQFINNLNQDIISDFYIEWNASTCQLPYLPLYEYNYKRVFKGCDCSQNKQEILIGKECTQQNLKQGCFTFNQELQQDLIYLNNNQFGAQFLICVKREKGISLKKNQTYCQLQEKTTCGIDIKYCLPKNITCPISEIGIKTFEEIDKSFINKSFINKSIHLGNNKYFYFGHNDNKIPISQVYLVKGEKICKLNNKLAFSEKQIISENSKETCNEIDNLFEIVYALSEEQLFLSNNLIQYKNELSHFYIDNIHDWTLQTKSYTLISDTCQENQFFQKILTNDYYDQFQKYKLIQIFWIFLIFLVAIFKLLANSCLNHLFFKSNVSRTNNHFLIKYCLQQNSQQQNCCGKVRSILSLLLLVGFLILTITTTKLEMNLTLEEIKQTLNIPCVVRDDANNYLKYFIQDQKIWSFYDVFYYSLIILQTTYILNYIFYIFRLFGYNIKRINKELFIFNNEQD